MKTTLAAIYSVLLCMSPALADDRDTILGVWKLQTWETVFQDTGERKALYGTPPWFHYFYSRRAHDGSPHCRGAQGTENGC